MSAVEKTTQYATVADDLPAAWAFVMAHIDDVGPDPRITISPIRSYAFADIGEEAPEPPRQFEVAVSGMTEEVFGR